MAADFRPRCQFKQHLDSLQAAGIHWLPRPAPIQPSAEPARAATSAMSASPPAPPAIAAVPDDRRAALNVLAREVAECDRCPELAATRTQTVFGVGRIGAELCFVGEAPGADEDKQGEPFVGAAGQLLNRIIAACGLSRDEVYICNTIKCRPPGNRTPLPNETGNCRSFFERQIELVRPRFICALGGTAAQALLQTTDTIGKMRGRFHDYKGIPVIVTYHPAYLLPHRNPAAKKDVWEDMKMLLAKMGRPIPTASKHQ